MKTMVTAEKVIFLVLFLIVCVTLWVFLSPWFSFFSRDTNIDFIMHVGNDYVLSRTNADTCNITHKGIPREELEIKPNIVAIAIYGPIVFGKATRSPDSSTGASLPGYFVLDTKSNKAFCGLSEVEWQNILSGQYQIQDLTLESPFKMFSKKYPKLEGRTRVDPYIKELNQKTADYLHRLEKGGEVK